MTNFFDTLHFNNYHIKKIEQIRTILDNNSYPPIFLNYKWKNFHRKNCYAYALDLNISDYKRKIWIPGCISNKNSPKEIYTTKNLLSRIKNDLSFLRISYRNNSEHLELNEWRIAIYYTPSHYNLPMNFHFCRQDFDGTWSEKPSWTAKIHKLDQSNSYTAPDLSQHNLFLLETFILKKIFS